ncbi:hypothetical protein HPB50_012325 [Hyalomma asiaticum]|uniref:Uncharacterized protein n=1 Tax=Hyalomma asiaticum TaxID=266040 RepID=A0ACB7RIV0_HYAAI|nr:hypothetical protein HPB50_012325 [Hyalomma asiaticum]
MAKPERSEASDADTGAPAAAPENKRGAKRGADGANRRPRNCLLLRDFLIPRLDQCLYGEDLEWLDRTEGVFRIDWTHQGKKSFDPDAPSVFRDWCILKGTWKDNERNQMVMAKQRLRAAFRKLPNLRRLEEGTSSHRVYRIEDIQSYLIPERNDDKKPKKEQQCACAGGCDQCMPEVLRPQSPASSSGDGDVGEPSEANGRGDAGSEGDSMAVSAPSPTVASNVWSSMHCLMESSSEPPTLPLPTTSESPQPPPPPSEPEEQAEPHDPFTRWSFAEIEAAKALLLLRYGTLEGIRGIPRTPPSSPQPAQPTSGPLATRGQVTVGASAPPSTARQQDQVVPVQAASSSPERSVDQGSSSPESGHAFEKPVATAVSTGSHSTEQNIVSGDSPLVFLANAAPAQREAELASSGVQDVGDMSFCPQAPKVQTTA